MRLVKCLYPVPGGVCGRAVTIAGFCGDHFDAVRVEDGLLESSVSAVVVRTPLASSFPAHKASGSKGVRDGR